MFVSGVIVYCLCHQESRHREGGGCFRTYWYSDVPGARSTRDGDTGNENDSNFAGFSNLTDMPCSDLP